MTDHQNSSAESCDLKPCPFCGSKIKHIESWAKSFKPPRLYHEWHHVEDNPDCQILRFSGKIVASATDNEEMRRAATARWNARPATDAQPAAEPFAYFYERATARTSSGKPALWQNELTFSKPDTHEFIRNVKPLYGSQPSPAATVEQDPASTFTDEEWHDALMGDPRPRSSAVSESAAVADQIIGQIEERFPDWRSFRDLIDCIDCTLHRLREGVRHG